MSVRSANSRTFDNIVLNDSTQKYIFVDFYAEWCAPCKKIAPKMKEFAKQYRNVTFLKINIENSPELAERYYVQSLPTFMLFRRGFIEPIAAPIMGINIDAITSLLDQCQLSVKAS